MKLIVAKSKAGFSPKNTLLPSFWRKLTLFARMRWRRWKKASDWRPPIASF